MINYDVIVVGAGHAGCEACLASARTGLKTLLITLSLDSIGFLPCNPNIGGTAKGHLVYEIDALGGEMGKIADKTTLHKKMLNETKGPAVHSLRVQVDKVEYHTEMKKVLENTPGLTILQAEVADILTLNNEVVGIKTTMGESFNCKAIVLCTGVYLNSQTLTGDVIKQNGPNGFSNATYLTQSLQKLGFTILRFKTGTPMRVDKRTIDFTQFEEQKGIDDLPNFSKKTKGKTKNTQICYIGYTNGNTHNILRDNLKLSPLYKGVIKGIGPRYCPSIEDKIVRFADKPRHQFFLEPEAESTNEIYVQGLSTSMPYFIQQNFIHSIKGLENSHIMRYAYAIEYDCIDARDLDGALAYKKVRGIYCAGQLNGTSGYEEAGAQGIVAGINASLFVRKLPPLILKRSEAYVGVLIDDLITKGTNEPYRMMTSRAEHRLYLRQDNADLRLSKYGHMAGLVSKSEYAKTVKKEEEIKRGEQILLKILSPSKELNDYLIALNENPVSTGITIKNLLKRQNINIFNFNDIFHYFDDFNKEVLTQLNILAKYEGYLKIENQQIQEQLKNENILIPNDIDFSSLAGLRLEARQKLARIKPINIGQAQRISGISPADIAVLTLYIKKHTNN